MAAVRRMMILSVTVIGSGFVTVMAKDNDNQITYTVALADAPLPGSRLTVTIETEADRLAARAKTA